MIVGVVSDNKHAVVAHSEGLVFGEIERRDFCEGLGVALAKGTRLDFRTREKRTRRKTLKPALCGGF